MPFPGLVHNRLKRVSDKSDHICDQGTASQVVRKNYHAAWRLEKKTQQIDEQRTKSRNSFERAEKQLLSRADKMRKSSGNLTGNDLHFTTTQLPQLVVSLPTAQRSRIPWKCNWQGRSLVMAAAPDETPTGQRGPSQWDVPKAKLMSSRKKSQQISNVPRFKKALRDSTRDVDSNLAICPKKLPLNTKAMKRLDDYETQCEKMDRLRSKSDPAQRQQHGNMDLLSVPKHRSSKDEKTMFQNWMPRLEGAITTNIRLPDVKMQDFDNDNDDGDCDEIKRVSKASQNMDRFTGRVRSFTIS
eukprot:gene9265-10243_t